MGRAALTEVQRGELLKDLLELKGQLEGVLADTRQNVKPVDLDLPIGRISRVDAIQQQRMAQASRHNNETRLRQVNSALAAAEEDLYGYCRLCDEPIGYRRLKAGPETPACVTCQSRRESER